MSAWLQAISPASGKALGPLAAVDETQAAERVDRAARAWSSWQKTSFSERARVLNLIAQRLRSAKNTLAELMALEMGKPLKEGLAEVEKAAWCAEHYAEFGADYLASQPLPSDADISEVIHQPLGVVLGILPWNAPVWLAFRFLAPALMAGNTCVMKHDPNTPGCAAAIAELFEVASVPTDIVVNAPVANPQVQSLIDHPAITAVSFTGSSGTGARVAAAAAAQLKPAVLELGGSDPLLVMADADLEAAADVAVLSRIINAGQSCIAAKRILVERPVYEAFCELVLARLARLKMGDPLLPETDMGPLARADLRANLHRQVEASKAAGARCLLGGDIPEGNGFFYPPTLLVDVEPGMPVFEEETFGPVMAVTPVADLKAALTLANQTDYGLGASIWTTNAAVAQRAIAELQAGQVAVNGIVKTDPRLPSGGIRRSGYGRELGPHGIRAFVNSKQVWLRKHWD